MGQVVENIGFPNQKPASKMGNFLSLLDSPSCKMANLKDLQFSHRVERWVHVTKWRNVTSFRGWIMGIMGMAKDPAARPGGNGSFPVCPSPVPQSARNTVGQNRDGMGRRPRPQRRHALTHLLHATSNLERSTPCLSANIAPSSSMARLRMSYGFAARRDLTEPGRGGLSFTQLTSVSQSCGRTRRPPSPTVPRSNIGPMGLSRSISKVRSPVPRGGFSSRLVGVFENWRETASGEPVRALALFTTATCFQAPATMASAGEARGNDHRARLRRLNIEASATLGAVKISRFGTGAVA